MKPIKIQKPRFRKAARSAAEYSELMMEHLQDVEDDLRALHEVDEEGWGIGQIWTMEHKDGRVANLPDPCPYEQIAQQGREAAEGVDAPLHDEKSLTNK